MVDCRLYFTTGQMLDITRPAVQDYLEIVEYPALYTTRTFKAYDWYGSRLVYYETSHSIWSCAVSAPHHKEVT